eukprot:jgi/Orpsp1_1/1187868/evm.model.d7180000060810.1
MIASLSLLFIPKYKEYFKFMTLDLWILYSIGAIFTVFSEFFYFGKLTYLKCILNHALTAASGSLMFITLIYRLTINFPKINKFSTWSKNHKIDFILILFFPHILFSILTHLFNGLKPVNVMLEQSKNYNVCVADKSFGNFISQVQIYYNVVLYIIVCILIFFEWNITETRNDVKTFSYIMIIDGITHIFIFIISYLNINNYLIYYSLYLSLFLLFPFVHHTFYFVIRIFFGFVYKSENDQKMIDKLLYLNNVTTSNIVVSSSVFTQSDESAMIKTSSDPNLYKSGHSKILNIHYATSQK